MSRLRGPHVGFSFETSQNSDAEKKVFLKHLLVLWAVCNILHVRRTARENYCHRVKARIKEAEMYSR